MTPEQYAQDKAAKSGSSFYYAFLYLPPPRRAAITAFYAFCREVDDVVDEVVDDVVVDDVGVVAGGYDDIIGVFAIAGLGLLDSNRSSSSFVERV